MADLFDVEALARQKAHSLVVPVKYEGGGALIVLGVRQDYQSQTDSEVKARKLEQTLVALLVDFAQEILQSSPVPAGLTDAELDSLRTSRRELAGGSSHSLATRQALAIAQAFENHVDHLHAILRSPEGQEYACGYDAGRRDLARQVLTFCGDGREDYRQRNQWFSLSPPDRERDAIATNLINSLLYRLEQVRRQCAGKEKDDE